MAAFTILKCVYPSNIPLDLELPLDIKYVLQRIYFKCYTTSTHV